jgi:hypothetical protein
LATDLQEAKVHPEEQEVHKVVEEEVQQAKPEDLEQAKVVAE